MLKAERKRAQAALARARREAGSHVVIDARKVEAFARLMRDVLGSGDTPVRKTYLRAIINSVEVGEKTVRIIGSKGVLHAAVVGKETTNGIVRDSILKWRAVQNKTANTYPIEITL